MSETRQAIKSRLGALEKEVNDFHPVLDTLFREMPLFTSVHRTHGPNEKGADFVLTQFNELVKDINYIGVIVKCGKIDSTAIKDIREQIEECSEPRLLEGLKQKIRLNEILVVSNGAISSRAQEKIYEGYASRNIRFAPLEVVTDWTLKHLPNYGQNLPLETSQYLIKEKESALQREEKYSLLPPGSEDLFVDQEIIRIDNGEFGSIKSVKVNFFNEVPKNNISVIESQMGSGKSKLLNKVVIYFSEPSVYIKKKIMPVCINFHKFIASGKDFNLKESIADIETKFNLKKDDERKFLFIIDGLDETSLDSEDEKDKVVRLLSEFNSKSNASLLLATRTLSDGKIHAEIKSRAQKYDISPLTLQQVLKFISGICKDKKIYQRLANDLKNSSLFKILPKTPIAAIILAKLVNEKNDDLPSNITDLYAQFCEYSLGRWDSEKGLKTLKDYEAADSILAEISHFILTNNLDGIPIGDAKSFFKDYLGRKNLGIDAEELFDSVIERSDILIYDELKNKITFKHRSFVEFFYARKLQTIPQNEIKIEVAPGFWTGR